MDIKKLISKLSKFGLVGVVTTLFGIMCYYIFLELWNWPLYPTYVFVFFMGSVLSYLMNSKFTFGRDYNLQTSTKYMLTYGMGLLVGLVLLAISKYFLGFLGDFNLVILVIVPRILFTYFILVTFVFTDKKMVKTNTTRQR